jgi:hypothetical protein
MEDLQALVFLVTPVNLTVPSLWVNNDDSPYPPEEKPQKLYPILIMTER